jgi:unsaturated rhamnogalacturonyl hydrolase
VLVLLANDSNNCDLPHLNLLAKKFGITFTNNSLNMVKNDTYVQGEVLPGANNPVFKTTKRMFLKELSELTVKAPAKALVTKDNAVIIAVAKYGKGTVFAVGDPWVYNEYIDNRKLLPAEFENYKAAEDLVKWLLQQAVKR